MNLYELLARVRSHATTDEDAEWLENEFDHFGLLLDCHNQHYRDLLASWEENARLREQVRSCQEQLVTLYGKLEHLEGELRRAEEVDGA